MASTVNGSASDGRFSCDVFRKYKRRKVSAIRDFPPGCGRFAPRINLTPKADIAIVDGIDNCVRAETTADILRNDSISQSSRVAQSTGHTETLEQINDLISQPAKPRVKTDQVGGLESNGVKPVLEVSQAPEGLDNIILKGPLKVSEVETSELSKSPHQLELHSVPPRLPSNPPPLEGSNDTGLNGPLKVSELESSEMSEDPHKVIIPSFEKQSVQCRSLDATVNSLVKHLTKDYPPPRKVFAVRDFPPFCGRNAPLLGKKESLEVVASSKIKSFGQQRVGAENNSIDHEERKIRQKKMGEDIQVGDADNNKLEENEFTTACRMQGAQGDTIKKSIGPPAESNPHCGDERVVEKGNMDAEDPEKNTEKEIVIYQQNYLKRKFPDISSSSEHLKEEDSEGLEGAQGTVVVYGLRAAPSSRERQDKMFSKVNMANVASEIKGKKRGHLEKSKYIASRVNERSSKMNMSHGNAREKPIDMSGESNQYSWEEIAVEKRDMDDGGLARNVGKEIVIYSEKRSPKQKLSDISASQGQLQGEYCEDMEVASGRIVVHALLAGAKTLRWQGKISSKLNPVPGTSGKKGKQHALKNMDNSEHAVRRKKVESKDSVAKSNMAKSLSIDNATPSSTNQLIVLDQDSSDDDEGIDDFHVAAQPRKFDLCLPPFGHNGQSSKGDEHDGCVTRNKVRETLRLFQAVCRKLLQEEETKLKEQGATRRRVDQAAGKILKEKGKYVNIGKQILGHVPGVEVGDEFHYRVELNIIGLHRQTQGGIDYVRHNGELVATSIVASGGYSDELDNSDFLIYTGSGGHMMGGDKEPEDQKLERGNLALKNSILAKNPVRVIRGFKDTKSSESSEARGKPAVVMTYVYDGLYFVEKSWQEEGAHGKLVFKFKLVRAEGQPELAWKQVKKSDKCKVREGLCDSDISRGKEIIPICAVNTIDDEKPPQFEYIRSMIYPDWCRPIPFKGCDCTKRCTESKKCSCAVMNGGEIPFNYNGAIVEAKPLVYECGPLCKCPPSCPNRVSQRGIRFQLEIFKTEKRGWGVRSLNSIPSGSFICEYAGELLEEKEADARTGNDEYLFDIGNNYNDTTLWGELSTLMPETNSTSSEIVQECFTIDAARYGNIGRFINHSCSPNLYAQNVLYDHEDRRVPHIMFFAAENIPPLQELTYHYNYTIDQVRDSNGNIKRKDCYCGAADCTGRMY